MTQIKSGIQVQMDLYHCQIVEGDLAMKIRQYLPTGRVGHLQIAGVPERHEPDVGEVNYPYLFRLLDQLGYDGWIGCEYRPARGAAAHATSEGLGWMKEWLQATFPALNATTCAGASGRGPETGDIQQRMDYDAWSRVAHDSNLG
ncbi:hypothetical protein GY15_00865 [Delftia sp. 670]|jgi:sugar phosphate isomerase/epimerase|nr:hypothetical protein GY15_00865 [Delftia sp. 670]BDE72589.1 hypothetical protein HQS1_37130 [Delftia lacustris]